MPLFNSQQPINPLKTISVVYLVPLVLILMATLVKGYAFSSVGSRIPLVLYILVIASAAVFINVRAAITAFIFAALMSAWILLHPSFYDLIPHHPYSLAALYGLSVYVMIIISRAYFSINNLNKRKQQELNLILDSVPNKVYISDAGGKATYYNTEWYNYTGCKSFQELAMVVWNLIPEEEVEQIRQQYPLHLQKAEPYEVEHRLRNVNGEYRWHLTRVKPLIENGKLTSWLGSCTDIHDQKMLSKKMDEFMSIASHELKTPITSIRGYLDIMDKKMSAENNQLYLSFVNRAKSQAIKLGVLINDLLDVSKSQEGKMHYFYQRFEAKQLINDSVHAIQSSFPDVEIKVEGEFHFEIVADKFRLEQVICNLLSNAIKYSKGNNQVLLTACQKDSSLQVSVKDYGIGIHEDQRPFIFDRFYRVEDKSYRASGLGIGLYICAEIIKRHAGEIWFNSIPGEGSEFIFSIPLEPQNPA